MAALSENGVIGRGNALPWHLPEDLRRFKRLTSGHTVVMGRKTYESIGSKPLPNRPTIVISSSPDLATSGVTVVPTLEQAFAEATGVSLLFILGGARVFEAALPYTDQLELTRVHATVPGDTFFPKVHYSDWQLAAQEDHPADLHHAYPFSFMTYDRKRGPLSFENREP
ncbi:MAG: dihydrofolate reductase [Gemmatimonadota bacterium]